MKKITFLLLILVISVAEKPVFVVSGTVFDEGGNALPGVIVSIFGSSTSTITDNLGKYSISIIEEASILQYDYPGYLTHKERVGNRHKLDVILLLSSKMPKVEMNVAEDREAAIQTELAKRHNFSNNMRPAIYHSGSRVRLISDNSHQNFDRESYNGMAENIFYQPIDNPLSTFSIDVDAASYSNIRRFLNLGQMPPKDAVRIEEMINYFKYSYPEPNDEHPFSIHTSYSSAPWNDKHLIAHIGIQGKGIETEDLPPSNMVFLIDVSGSMNAQNKLPLLKSSMKMLVNEMRPKDKVAIVVYAGAAGLVLNSTDGSQKSEIIDVLDNLEAGGSTAGGAGIQLAYKVAKEQFVQQGNNRIILATDGDFNVGASSDMEMQRLIERKRSEGVFLTVLGFGMGNFKDAKMEILADKGNGNYAYIDNIQEAKKVLVTEFGSTLYTIAKDVKIQVEFNPDEVEAYRLIGYENRKLNDEDFNNDKKDAGELGSGHSVTALYEIIPKGVENDFIGSIDPLKYQFNHKTKQLEGEILTVKFRYKLPDGDKSMLITTTISREENRSDDENLQWALSVAGFGMLLRDSEFKGDLTYDKVINMGNKAKGKDEYGYRGAFLTLVEIAGRMQ